MMLQQIVSLGSPRRCYHFCGKLMPGCFLVGLLAMLYGLGAGSFWVPADYQQGEAFRIIYIHVPCAMLSLLIYVAMAFLSAIFLIWRIKIADIFAYCAAPLGAFFTVSTLITGALWGKPMWGTWWIWDARLTAELILLFLYVGYIGLYQAIPQKKTAAKICAILAIVGVVNIPIIHYSVYWWSTLHQGSTLFKIGAPSIAPVMLFPLLASMVGMGVYALAIFCIRVRTEIILRESQNHWVQALLAKER